MDTGAWRAAVHRVSKSLTQLSGHTRMHKWRHFQEESKRSHPLLFNSIIEVLANKEQSIRGIRIHGAMHGPVGLLGPGPLCPLFLWSQETAFTQPPWPSLSSSGQIQAVVFFSSSSFLFIYLFYFLTLQYCIGFAIYQHESATAIHVFPILNPPPSSLPAPSPWVVPVHQPQASSIVHRTWTGDSFHIWYYTYFNAILPNHPTLSLSHRVQKTVLYISVSFAVS